MAAKQKVGFFKGPLARAIAFIENSPLGKILTLNFKTEGDEVEIESGSVPSTTSGRVINTTGNHNASIQYVGKVTVNLGLAVITETATRGTAFTMLVGLVGALMTALNTAFAKARDGITDVIMVIDTNAKTAVYAFMGNFGTNTAQLLTGYTKAMVIEGERILLFNTAGNAHLVTAANLENYLQQIAVGANVKLQAEFVRGFQIRGQIAALGRFANDAIMITTDSGSVYQLTLNYTGGDIVTGNLVEATGRMNTLVPPQRGTANGEANRFELITPTADGRTVVAFQTPAGEHRITAIAA